VHLPERNETSSEYGAPAAQSKRSVGYIFDSTTEMIDRVWMWFGNDALPRMAAALAYRTIFSLIPLLFIAFISLRLFDNSNEVVESLLRRLLSITGLSAISVDVPSSGLTGPSVLDAPPEVLAAFKTELGAYYPSFEQAERSLREGQPGSVEQWIGKMVSRFTETNFGAVGIVSAATLIYAALSLLFEVEASFNAIYNASRNRSWVKRILQYWLVISLGPILLYTGFFVADRFASISSNFATSNTGSAAPWLITFAGYLATVSISTVLLFTLYVIVPNTVIRLRPAFLGAFIASCLLEAAKFGFTRYFSTEGYRSVFGALALLPLFLLWVYIIWFIVLFGLRVSFLIQAGRSGVLLGALRASAGGSLGLAGGSWVEPARSVSVAVAVAESFDKGVGVQLERLVEKAAMPEPSVRILLRRLEDAGILHRIARERGSDTGRAEIYMLSRPADKILASEVVAVGQLLAGPVAPGPAGELISKIRQAQVDAVSGVTLASLIPKRLTPQTMPAKAAKQPSLSLPAAVAGPDIGPTEPVSTQTPSPQGASNGAHGSEGRKVQTVEAGPLADDKPAQPMI